MFKINKSKKLIVFFLLCIGYNVTVTMQRSLILILSKNKAKVANVAKVNVDVLLYIYRATLFIWFAKFN
jgi:hypothetical protein